MSHKIEVREEFPRQNSRVGSRLAGLSAAAAATQGWYHQETTNLDETSPAFRQHRPRPPDSPRICDDSAAPAPKHPSTPTSSLRTQQHA